MAHRIIKTLLFTVFAIISANCFVINSQRNVKIIGGGEAEPGQFRHQVSITLFYTTSLNKTIYAHSCGGSILNSNWIITAARCIFWENPNEYILIVGPNRTLTNDNSYEIDQVVTHPGFKGLDTFLANDLSLIKTRKPIVFNDFVQPIDMSSTVIDENVECQVSGWGFTRYQTPVSVISAFYICLAVFFSVMIAFDFSLFTA